MKEMPKVEISPAKGKLGILTPGMGAVATTFIAGIIAIRNKIAKPIGSLTQMGTVRLGRRTEKRIPTIKEFVSLSDLDDIVFGGWDIFEDDAYQSALNAGVLDNSLLNSIKPELEAIKPMRGVFSKDYVKKLDGQYIKSAKTKWDYAQMLMDDINQFKDKNNLDRLSIVWCGSTEIFLKPEKVHQSLQDFEKGLKENHQAIAPSMIYAYAALKLGVPYANGAPNLTIDFPAMYELAKETVTPISGKDFKTGQTLMKTILAPP
jgi:myo-inositol-1-phosphate synthase